MAERAMKAEEDGDMAMANRLYNIGAGLGRAVLRANPATAVPSGAGTANSPLIIEGLRVTVPITGNNQITKEIKVVQPLDKTKPSETASGTGGLICDNSAVPTSVNWQDKAIMHWSEKKPKAEAAGTDVFCYLGYPYPSEYCQTYNKWSVNHQGFYAALRKIPTTAHTTFAGWLVMHKKHCDTIIIRDGYMTGLRYDIQIRANAFAHRVTLGDGRRSVANISVYREDVVRKAYGKATKLDKVNFPNKLYSAGGRRYGWDTATASQKLKATTEVTLFPYTSANPRAVKPKESSKDSNEGLLQTKQGGMRKAAREARSKTREVTKVTGTTPGTVTEREAKTAVGTEAEEGTFSRQTI
ncbi:hypothetical protein PTTG_05904 [Puccinia triticina 1-1 BBBD Race 1]|uniref:Uncharacterized protein n=1 Tax=Puccinia triticina (isolate 1-1 / race 1 (BBBD)) TaxID=630390 RepID=A0A180GXK9_PUCT1|nr:hypothetical protein PTTG_05904 [Puccinia triticina 1-1 BBBD Race 1]